ncbi:MAG: hypothetical protein KDD37_05685 [Bdellovibrionales bacterium]|nr:hypothetical protein [Bdellovibrionales bacterium]
MFAIKSAGMMKWTFLLILISNLAHANSAAKANLCGLSSYTAKVMSSMHTTEYRSYILENVANSEGAKDFSLNDVAEKAKAAYSSKDHEYLSPYTPYALLNLVVHSALQSDRTSFDASLNFTLDLCEDFSKKRHAICIMGSSKYSPSKKDKESLCSNTGVSLAMDEVCTSAESIESQRQDFFRSALNIYKSLKAIDYFERKDNPKIAKVENNTGVIFTGGLAMIMGQRMGKSLASAGQYTNSKNDLNYKKSMDEKEVITNKCKEEGIEELGQYLNTPI